MQHRHHPGSNLWLIIHTIMPTGASIIGGFIITVSVVGFHLLFLSQQAELLLPHFAGTVNDQLIEIYSEKVTSPIDDAFNNSALSTLTTAMLWGFVGWAIYALLDWIIGIRRDLKSGQEQINVQGQGKVIRHPLRNQVFIRLFWRFFIGMIMICATIALLPVLGNLLKHDVLFLQADTYLEMFKEIGIIIGGWLLILHIYVVLFRLFVMRTRVFGEILY